jgi:hypothetical protein
MEIKSLLVKISADASEFNAALKQSHSKLQEVGRTFQTIGAGLSAAVSLPMMAVGTAAIKMAMEATESENLFEVSMGNMAGAARRWSEELRKQLGLNAYEVRKNVGTFYNMFNAMGMGKQSSYELSTGLTKLAYDMASFYNLNPEEAFQKLRAGITGEIEPLKRLGIVVDEASIKSYAYTHGIATLGIELTQQQKILARYGLIMEQTKTAQGDLARTMDSPTNKLRILSSQLKQVAVDFGMALLPVFSSGLGVAKKLVSGIGEVVRVFNSLPGPIKSIIIMMAGLAAAAGPVLMITGTIMTKLPAIIAGIKLLIGVINPLTLAIGAATAAGIGLYTVLHQLKEQKEYNKEASQRLAEAEDRLKSKLWEAAQQAGLTGEQFKTLTDKYNGNIAAMASAVQRGGEGIELQQALAEVGKRHTEVINKQREAQEKQRAEMEKGLATQGQTKEQIEKIITLRRQLADEIKKATLSELEYSRASLKTQYEERLAQINQEISDEKSRAELLTATRQAYYAQLEALEKSAREKELKDRIEFVKKIKEQEDEMTLARIEAEKEYLAKKQEISAAIQMMSMSEKEQKLFSLKQERLAKIAALEEERSLNQIQKDNLLALWNEYYAKKREEIEKEYDSWLNYVNLVQDTIENTLTTCIYDFLGAFASWGEQAGSILGAIGNAFKSMARTAITALQDLIVATLKSAIKTIAAKKAEAIASQIANVMKSIPFPLNLALVAGAIAAVSKLFSAIKLAEGGIITRPTLAVVGERGPEAVIPLNRYPVPAVAAATGSGINLTVNLYGNINNAGGIDEISERMASKLQSLLRGGLR